MKAKQSHKIIIECLLAMAILTWYLPGASLADEAYGTTIRNGMALSACRDGKLVRYRLIEGSMLVDDCTICGRPPIPIPIRGYFWLELVEQNPLFSDYLVRGLTFTGTFGDSNYVGRMEGTYHIGGEVAILQQMTLEGRISQYEDLKFASEAGPPQSSFPWIEIDVLQLPPADPLHTFSIHIVAVPWPRVLFSTETGFTSSARSTITHVSDGDLLSSSGQVVRTNRELTDRLGIKPIVPDVGLDAVAGPMPVLSLEPHRLRGEFWFSAEQDVFSGTLGLLRHGDLLSSTGWVVRRNGELIKPFAPQPPVEDYGLDAVTRGPDGVLLFSTEKGFFSESLGMSVGDGDLLREDGKIYKTCSDLLAKFHPIEPRPIPFGLDAVYVWPNGEVWFSIEVDFVDGLLGPIGHGDLLSDIGRVVVRNRELMAPFKPLEKISDFGLDSIQVLRRHCAADLNLDGNVDLLDLAILTQSWDSNDTAARWNPDCDINIPADNIVDLPDLAAFAEQWLEGMGP